MTVSSERFDKGSRKMRGLASGIARLDCLRRSVTGTLAPGPSLDIEDLIDFSNALDDALVTVRTLDLEVFQRSYSQESDYLALRASTREGRVVHALTGPRNSAVHHVEVFDPDISRAVGPFGDNNTYVIFPRWKPRAQLSTEMFVHFSGSSDFSGV